MGRGKKKKSGARKLASLLPKADISKVFADTDDKASLTFNAPGLPGVQNPLTIRDVQQLVLWVVGNWIQVSPKWIFVRNKSRINKSAEFCAVADSIFHQNGVIDTQAPGSKYRIYPAIETLLNVPTGKKQPPKKQKIVEPCNMSSLMLTLFERSAHDYPLLEATHGNPDWLQLPEGKSEHKVVSIDCEMCLTAEGDSLTRVSVVAEDGAVLLDELVMPSQPILDYKTRYSGIDKSTLAGVTTTLKDVQVRLAAFLSRSTVLVGHSLENDLKALKLYHERVVDTSVLYPHRQGLPYKNSLRFLTQKYLHREIQQDSHNSIEDAQAALELAKLKTLKGVQFGDPEAENGDTESLFSKLAQDWATSAPLPAGKRKVEEGSPAASTIEAVKKPFVLLDATNWKTVQHQSEFADVRVFESDDETHKETLVECAQEHRRLVISQYDGLRELFNQANKLDKEADREQVGSTVFLTPQVLAAVSRYAQLMREVYSALPAGAMLIVSGLHGDFLKATRALKKKNEVTNWSMDQDLDLQQLVHHARITKSAFAVKK